MAVKAARTCLQVLRSEPLVVPERVGFSKICWPLVKDCMYMMSRMAVRCVSPSRLAKHVLWCLGYILGCVFEMSPIVPFQVVVGKDYPGLSYQ